MSAYLQTLAGQRGCLGAVRTLRIRDPPPLPLPDYAGADSAAAHDSGPARGSGWAPVSVRVPDAVCGQGAAHVDREPSHPCPRPTPRTSFALDAGSLNVVLSSRDNLHVPVRRTPQLDANGRRGSAPDSCMHQDAERGVVLHDQIRSRPGCRHRSPARRPDGSAVPAARRWRARRGTTRRTRHSQPPKARRRRRRACVPAQLRVACGSNKAPSNCSTACWTSDQFETSWYADFGEPHALVDLELACIGGAEARRVLGDDGNGSAVVTSSRCSCEHGRDPVGRSNRGARPTCDDDGTALAEDDLRVHGPVRQLGQHGTATSHQDIRIGTQLEVTGISRGPKSWGEHLRLHGQGRVVDPDAKIAGNRRRWRPQTRSRLPRSS